MKKIFYIMFLCFNLGLSLSFGQAMCGAVPVTDEADIKDDSGVKIEDVLKDFFDFCAKSKSKDPEVEALIKDLKKKVEENKFIPMSVDSGKNVTVSFSVNGLKIDLNCIAGNNDNYASVNFTKVIGMASFLREYNPDETNNHLLDVENQIKHATMQARFIYKYLSKSKLKLTPYEKSILTSYKDNNLYDFMFKYYAIDAEWLDYLKEVFSSESTAKGKLKQLRDIGEKKIEESKLKLKEGTTEEEIYNALVMPAMYCELVPYYVYILTDGKKSGKSREEYDWAGVDPKLAETMAKLKEIITPFLGGLKYKDKLRENISKIPVKSESK